MSNNQSNRQAAKYGEIFSLIFFIHNDFILSQQCIVLNNIFHVYIFPFNIWTFSKSWIRDLIKATPLLWTSAFLLPLSSHRIFLEPIRVRAGIISFCRRRRLFQPFSCSRCFRFSYFPIFSPFSKSMMYSMILDTPLWLSASNIYFMIYPGAETSPKGRFRRSRNCMQDVKLCY